MIREEFKVASRRFEKSLGTPLIIDSSAVWNCLIDSAI
jgi:hypothetical protein